MIAVHAVVNLVSVDKQFIKQLLKGDLNKVNGLILVGASECIIWNFDKLKENISKHESEVLFQGSTAEVCANLTEYLYKMLGEPLRFKKI